MKKIWEVLRDNFWVIDSWMIITFIFCGVWSFQVRFYKSHYDPRLICERPGVSKGYAFQIPFDYQVPYGGAYVKLRHLLVGNHVRMIDVTYVAEGKKYIRKYPWSWFTVYCLRGKCDMPGNIVFIRRNKYPGKKFDSSSYISNFPYGRKNTLIYFEPVHAAKKGQISILEFRISKTLPVMKKGQTVFPLGRATFEKSFRLKFLCK